MLYDDRVNVSAGEKLADADLIGIPWRLVVSKKTRDKVEIRSRRQPEIKIVSESAILSQLAK